LILIGIGDAQVIVKGTLGENVFLPCHVDQDNCGDVYFITWTKYEKDDHWSRIYLYADNVEKPLRDLAGRAKFSIQRNEAHLSINRLKDNDESLYKVRKLRFRKLMFIKMNLTLPIYRIV